jgi:protein SCO1/2
MNISLTRPMRDWVLALLACIASPMLVAAPLDAPLNAPAAAPEKAAASALPTDSVYQLPLSLTDQQGRKAPMADRRGHPVLVSMFYTSCQFVCPMLVEALRDTEAKLSAEERARLSVLMVSFDPEHDSVAVLKRTAEQRGLDSSHWTLARTDAKSVRKLAAVLGIQYRALANGDFNHTTALILLDAEGRIAGRSSQLGNADPAFVKLVKAAAQRAPI